MAVDMTMAAGALVQSPTDMVPEARLPDLPNTKQPSHSRSQDMSAAGANGPRRRRPSKSVSGISLKRSASTPTVRGVSGQTDMPLSLSAEKRRNKLGYHRTSVACVHCRRRKIRCLAAPEDPQNRCSNCIRLKKECNFFPVDQQAAQERRPRTGSKVEAKSGDNSASSSSSPGLTVRTSTDQVENFNHFPLMPVATGPFSGPMVPVEAAVMSPPGSAAPYTAHFEFPDQQSHHHWEAQYSEGHEPHRPDEYNSNFWIKPETPITPSYPPYAQGVPNESAHGLHDPVGAYRSYGPSKTEAGWHPSRSMSYSHLEDVAHSSEAFHPLYHTDSGHSVSDMLPPSLGHSGSSSIASAAENPTTTLGGPSPIVTMANQGIPYAWQHAIPTQSPKSLDFGWYSDQAPLGKVQEEQEIQPHYVDDPNAVYSGGHRP